MDGQEHGSALPVEAAMQRHIPAVLAGEYREEITDQKEKTKPMGAANKGMAKIEPSVQREMYTNIKEEPPFTLRRS